MKFVKKNFCILQSVRKQDCFSNYLLALVEIPFVISLQEKDKR